MKLNETYNNYIIFNKLKNYIITDKKYNNILHQGTSNKKPESKKNENKNNFKPYLIYPKQYDKLFWCFYIIKNGVDDYKDIDNKHFLIEKEVKLDFVQTIRANSSLLKDNKIKKIETELDIANSRQISINSFHALCLYNHLNVTVLSNNIYYSFISNNESPMNIIDISTNFTGCRVDIDDNLLNDLLKNKICVENPNRPLRSVTFYKLDDLHEYCKKLAINYQYSSGKSKKKQEIYNEIKQLLI
tara:strand:- start:109 stop:840 length:732 start_codon:yes stop_codon:yes gene_type:complete